MKSLISDNVYRIHSKERFQNQIGDSAVFEILLGHDWLPLEDRLIDLCLSVFMRVKIINRFGV